jgi:hypothetical protein
MTAAYYPLFIDGEWIESPERDESGRCPRKRSNPGRPLVDKVAVEVDHLSTAAYMHRSCESFRGSCGCTSRGFARCRLDGDIAHEQAFDVLTCFSKSSARSP